MNLRIVIVCLLLIALALYTMGRASEERQRSLEDSSESALNQTSWTNSDFVERDGFFQLLVYREDVPWPESDPWYEPPGAETECCPAVPPLDASFPLDLPVQELLEKFI